MSIVIPTHGRPRELRRAIATVRRQTLQDWELVIVDDGSPEPMTLPPEAADDHRITLIRHDECLGVSHARNAAIARSVAPWIAFLDDDDLWWPGKLAAQVAAAEEHGATFLFTGRHTVDASGRMLHTSKPEPTGDLAHDLLFSNLVGEPSTVMVHRDALAAAGGFDPELSVVADWDLWLRLSRIAVPESLPQATSAIVFHAGSMQLTLAHRVPDELAIMRERHRDALATETRALGCSFVDVWLADKHWRAQRSASSFLNYVRVAHRHGELLPVARQIVMRKARRLAGRPCERAPGWVLEQLGAEA